MKVDVELESIKVSKFSPKDFSVELEVAFFDGDYRKFHKSVFVDEPDLTQSIFEDIRKMIKNRSFEFNGQVIKGHKTLVRIKDKNEVEKKIVKFFADLKSRVNKVKNTKQAEGYIDSVNKVRILTIRI